MKKLLVVSLSILFLCTYSFAQSAQEKKQFIYVLKLVPKYLDLKNWSEADNKAVGEHFARLQKMEKEGALIIAGKTENWDEKMFGIVIYEAESFDRAKEIAESDPAVKAGVMTVETFPYKVALINDKRAK